MLHDEEILFSKSLKTIKVMQGEEGSICPLIGSNPVALRRFIKSFSKAELIKFAQKIKKADM